MLRFNFILGTIFIFLCFFFFFSFVSRHSLLAEAPFCFLYSLLKSSVSSANTKRKRGLCWEVSRPCSHMDQITPPVSGLTSSTRVVFTLTQEPLRASQHNVVGKVNLCMEDRYFAFENSSFLLRFHCETCVGRVLNVTSKANGCFCRFFKPLSS